MGGVIGPCPQDGGLGHLPLGKEERMSSASPQPSMGNKLQPERCCAEKVHHDSLSVRLAGCGVFGTTNGAAAASVAFSCWVTAEESISRDSQDGLGGEVCLLADPGFRGGLAGDGRTMEN